MKLDINSEILDYFGRPVMIDKELKAKWGDIIMMALLQKKETIGNQKLVNFQISVKIANALQDKQEVELTLNEINYIKTTIEEIESPLILGRFHEIYERLNK